MAGNVPYYAKMIRTSEKRNLTAAEVGAEIIKDLDAAIALLPPTPRNANAGRATSWAAKAYKGRVQVYAGNFAGALTTLREVRNSGAFALESSYDKVWTGFSSFANGKETILAYQASANDGEPNGGNSNYGERLNFRIPADTSAAADSTRRRRTSSNSTRSGADGLPLDSVESGGWNASNANFSAASKGTGRSSPRLHVGRDGVPYKDWAFTAPRVVGLETWPTEALQRKKMAHEKATAPRQRWMAEHADESVNMHLFRYAEHAVGCGGGRRVEAGSLATR